ncbi:MAG: AraC family transcriptional regulator [Paenibacillus sp.]|nr:AraC family transcriptional regulator [Paenibacillus sp.]
MSVFEYLQKLRIEEACRLLAEGSDKITDIAGTVGYGDYRFFNKTFRKMTGMTAQQYRKKANAELYIAESDR